MTLQEAIKTGLRFKRPNHKLYFMDNGGYIDDIHENGEPNGTVLTTEDIMGSDWAVEPMAHLSAGDIRKAARKIALDDAVTDVLLKGLGL
jgi:hypothetical protein